MAVSYDSLVAIFGKGHVASQANEGDNRGLCM